MFIFKDNDTVETLLSLNQYVHEWHVKAYPNIFRDHAEEEFKKYFQSTLESPDCYHYVAYDDSRAIGLIQAKIKMFKGSAFCQPNKLVYVNIIVVHPEYRGKGVGHLLMNKVYELADKNGISRIELDHWEGNESASSFFGELGFKPFRHFMFIERK